MKSTLLTYEPVRLTERPFTEFARLNPGHYIVEAKYDGERVLVTVTNEKVEVKNRYGTSYNFSFLPEYEAEVRFAVGKMEKPVVLDAEFVSLGGDLYSFLKDRANAIESLQLIVFDLLNLGGKDLTGEPLLNRKRELNRLVNTRRVKQIDYKIAPTIDEVWSFYHSMVLKLKFEGIVVKPVGSIYGNGAWCKLKKNVTHDVVLLGVKKTEAFLRDKIPRSFLIGFLDEEGKTIPYGNVSSGWQHVKTEDLVYVEGRDAYDKDYRYVDPTVVVELMAHSLLETKRFREPRILRQREDKRATDCKPPNGH